MLIEFYSYTDRATSFVEDLYEWLTQFKYEKIILRISLLVDNT